MYNHLYSNNVLSKKKYIEKSNIFFASLMWNNYENCLYRICFLFFSVPCVCWFRFVLFKSLNISSTAVKAASCHDVWLEADWSSNSIYFSASDWFWDNDIFFPFILIYLFTPYSPPFRFCYCFLSLLLVLCSGPFWAPVSTLPGFRDNWVFTQWVYKPKLRLILNMKGQFFPLCLAPHSKSVRHGGPTGS